MQENYSGIIDVKETLAVIRYSLFVIRWQLKTKIILPRRTQKTQKKQKQKIVLKAPFSLWEAICLEQIASQREKGLFFCF